MATDNNMTYSPDAVGTIDRHRYDYTNHMTDIDMIGRIFRSQFYGSKPAMDTARWITARRRMDESLLMVKQYEVDNNARLNSEIQEKYELYNHIL